MIPGIIIRKCRERRAERFGELGSWRAGELENSQERSAESGGQRAEGEEKPEAGSEKFKLEYSTQSICKVKRSSLRKPSI